MDYEYDVFISYRREGLFQPWVVEEFLPLFEFYLGQELAPEKPKPAIFIDRDIETGVAWPQKLAQCLAHSRVLVCLWSPQYFASDWCLAELAVMRAREQACQLATAAMPGGLIVPAAINDGKRFPSVEGITQYKEFEDVVRLRMAKGSRMAERLEKRIKDWVPNVKSAIERAKPFDPEWQQLPAETFMKLFRTHSKQTTVPGKGAP